MDADTTSTKGSHAKLLEAFAEDQADILLGTQMVTKGLDFDRVTLVGIVDADQSLFAQDYRRARAHVLSAHAGCGTRRTPADTGTGDYSDVSSAGRGDFGRSAAGLRTIL